MRKESRGGVGENYRVYLGKEGSCNCLARWQSENRELGVAEMIEIIIIIIIIDFI